MLLPDRASLRDFGFMRISDWRAYSRRHGRLRYQGYARENDPILAAIEGGVGK
jgi:hypothetical protein